MAFVKLELGILHMLDFQDFSKLVLVPSGLTGISAQWQILRSRNGYC